MNNLPNNPPSPTPDPKRLLDGVPVINVKGIKDLHAVLEHELGWADHNMRRDRPYQGQPNTMTGLRGATEIKGITMRDLRDCFIRAVLMSTGGPYWPVKEEKDKMAALYEQANRGEDAVICENDLYGFDLDKLDPMAVVQNLCCEVERIMGIYPNITPLTINDPGAAT